MASWLTRLLSRTAAVPTRPSAAVRQALQAAMERNAIIVLEAPGGLIAVSEIHSITGEELIIAQPSVGGVAYPLAEDETFKLSFVQQETNLSGRCTCLGRMRSDGAKRGAFVYRMSLPSNLLFEDRRSEPRNPILPQVAPQVTVQGLRSGVTMTGALADISISGLRVHLATEPPGLETAQELTVQFRMPEPAGMIDEVVEVQRFFFDEACGLHAICCSFRRRVPRLESLLRLTTQREPMPLQQAQRRVA